MAEFYKVTRPEGVYKVYDVDSAEEAGKHVDAQIKQEAIQKSRTSMAEAPTWAKPFMYADDAAKVFADSVTLGRLAPAVGDETGVATARDRLGLGAVPFDIAGGIATPGGIPSMLGRIGGGAIMRGLGKGAGAAVEGGIVGGVQAGHDDEPLSGRIGQGALAGVLGQAGASVVGKGVNKLGNWWKGVDDALPPASLSNFPNKAPSPARRVENAAIRVEKEGGDQKTAADVFGALKPRGYGPEELAGIERVVKGDPGTRLAVGTEKFIKDKSTMAQVATGFSLQDLKASLAAAIGLPMAQKAAGAIGKQGTQEAIDDLRRLTLKKPKIPGMLSPDQIDRMGRGGRNTILQKILEDEQD